MVAVRKHANVEAEPAPPQAILTFNAVAARAVFPDSGAKALRIRIEHGDVYVRSAKNLAVRDGEITLPIEWRARGVVVPVTGKRLLNRFYRLGLAEQRPYFGVDAANRGWFFVIHHATDEPPPRAPLVTVSGFEPAPVTVNPVVWRQLQRQLAKGLPITEQLWSRFLPMATHAARIMAIRATRMTLKRAAADRLVKAMKRHVEQFHAVAERQPELADSINVLMEQITGKAAKRRQVAETVTPEEDDENAATPEVTESYVSDVVAARSDQELTDEQPRSRRRRATNFAESLAAVIEAPPPPSPAPAENDQAEGETVVRLRPQRKRRWPMIPPMDLTEPDPPESTPQPELEPQPDHPGNDDEGDAETDDRPGMDIEAEPPVDDQPETEPEQPISSHSSEADEPGSAEVVEDATGEDRGDDRSA